MITNQERNAVIRLKDGKAEWVEVRNGVSLSNRIEIFGDLNDGDQLLVRANEELVSGTPIVGKIASVQPLH